MFFHYFKEVKKGGRGFTLVEMIVSLSIFALITTVVLARYRDFNGGIILSNLAYEIAITVRQAQVYGLSVKDASASNFNVRYGIHLAYPTNNSFFMFADTDGNGQYSGSSEIVETISPLQGNTIDNFCAQPLSGQAECGSGTPTTLSWLDIAFLRPNPDALFRSSSGNSYQSATITVKSPRTGATRTITIRATGQISVQ